MTQSAAVDETSEDYSNSSPHKSSTMQLLLPACLIRPPPASPPAQICQNSLINYDKLLERKNLSPHLKQILLQQARSLSYLMLFASTLVFLSKSRPVQLVVCEVSYTGTSPHLNQTKEECQDKVWDDHENQLDIFRESTMEVRQVWNSLSLAQMRFEKSYFESSSLEIWSIFLSRVGMRVLRKESISAILPVRSAPMFLSQASALPQQSLWCGSGMG